MKWLLLVFVFRVDAGGNPQQPTVFYKSYISESECNHVGSNFRDVFRVPAEHRSMSICIPEDSFEASDWRVVEPGRR